VVGWVAVGVGPVRSGDPPPPPSGPQAWVRQLVLIQRELWDTFGQPSAAPSDAVYLGRLFRPVPPRGAVSPPPPPPWGPPPAYRAQLPHLQLRTVHDDQGPLYPDRHPGADPGQPAAPFPAEWPRDPTLGDPPPSAAVRFACGSSLIIIAFPPQRFAPAFNLRIFFSKFLFIPE